MTGCRRSQPAPPESVSPLPPPFGHSSLRLSSPLRLRLAGELGDLGDLQVCVCRSALVGPGGEFLWVCGGVRSWMVAAGGGGERRTGGEAGLELLGLLGVLDGEGVEEALAPDLELGLVVLLVALDHRSCRKVSCQNKNVLLHPISLLPNRFKTSVASRYPSSSSSRGAVASGENLQEASFLRQISMN